VRVAACANWPGQDQGRRPWTGMIHAVDILPTFAALAGASTAKCKPLDGFNVWDVMAANQASPRSEILLGVEPYRAAVRQGDYKLIWRTMLPSATMLYDLAEDPFEQKDLAAAQPEKVAALKARLEAAAKEAAPPLFLKYVGSVGLAHGTPNLAGSAGAQAADISHAPSPTDEGAGDAEKLPAAAH
jgi:arylsulfatase A-like enzyme